MLKWPARSQGFTLLELIVTLIIAGILFSIGAPNLADFLANQRVRVAIADLHADLQFARAYAVQRQLRVALQTINGANWQDGWQVCVAANATVRNCSNSPEILRAQPALGNGLVSCSSQAGLAKGQMAFRPDGRVDTAAALAGNEYIRISDSTGTRVRSIYFGPTGRLSEATELGGAGC